MDRSSYDDEQKDFTTFWINNKGKIKKYFFIAIAFILLLFVNPCQIVDAGHKGVVLNCGAVSDNVRSEGLNFKIPFIQSIQEVDVRVRKIETETEAPSKDLQEIKKEKEIK